MSAGSSVNATAALWRHARERGGALAVVDGSRRWTWAELASAVAAVADHLRAQGLAPGDRVALVANDGAPALIAALAVLAVGGVHAPVDHTLTAPEVAALVAGLRTRWLARLDSNDDIRLEATGQPPIADPLAPESSAFLRFSSGTTGAAKGVLLSHRTIAERVAAANRGLGLQVGDRVLWLLPLAYHFAVSVLLYIEYGVALVFGNSLRASATAAIARAEAVTTIYASPWHIRRLAELPPGEDLPPSLRQVVSTTTALAVGVAADFRRRHGVGVRQALGIIEVGLPLISAGLADEELGAFGSPLPDYRAVIRDAAGSALPPGAPGELTIAGPGLLDAYLEPWRTRAHILDDGFFRTGDLAVIDAAGAVCLLGRCKDLINVAGIKVFPLEIEAVLCAHPAVTLCRVRGLVDPRTGERIHAEVQLRPGVERSTAVTALFAWCRERLAPLKCPAAIELVDALPMTGSGKVRRGAER